MLQVPDIYAVTYGSQPQLSMLSGRARDVVAGVYPNWQTFDGVWPKLPLPAIAKSNFTVLTAKSGPPDLYAIKVSPQLMAPPDVCLIIQRCHSSHTCFSRHHLQFTGTKSGNVELVVLSASSGYSATKLSAVLPLPVNTQPGQTYTFAMGASNDIFAIQVSPHQRGALLPHPALLSTTSTCSLGPHVHWLTPLLLVGHACSTTPVPTLCCTSSARPAATPRLSTPSPPPSLAPPPRP